MDFNEDRDWAAFLKLYIDMDGVIYLDPAWPVALMVDYAT
jgi:hypothetical protein